MGKPSKAKKDKVPRISEQEYAEYLFSLRKADDKPTNGGEENSKLTESQ
ncbi:MAG: hypothetical protein J6A63_06355 [Clostridia bacterium]|nr:hypothetical protein [Clostridia bacterium]